MVPTYEFLIEELFVCRIKLAYLDIKDFGFLEGNFWLETI